MIVQEASVEDNRSAITIATGLLFATSLSASSRSRTASLHAHLGRKIQNSPGQLIFVSHPLLRHKLSWHNAASRLEHLRYWYGLQA